TMRGRKGLSEECCAESIPNMLEMPYTSTCEPATPPRAWPDAWIPDSARRSLIGSGRLFHALWASENRLDHSSFCAVLMSRPTSRISSSSGLPGEDRITPPCDTIRFTPDCNFPGYPKNSARAGSSWMGHAVVGSGLGRQRHEAPQFPGVALDAIYPECPPPNLYLIAGSQTHLADVFRGGLRQRIELRPKARRDCAIVGDFDQ